MAFEVLAPATSVQPPRPVVTFGDAGFFGSAGGRPLVRPVVGLAS